MLTAHATGSPGPAAEFAASANRSSTAGDIPAGFVGTLLDNVGLGVMLLNRAGEIVFTNRWLRDRWQGSTPILPGGKLRDLLAGRRSGRLLPAVDLCLQLQQSSLLSHYLNRSLLPLCSPGRDDDRDYLSQNIAIRPLADARHTERRYCLIEVSDVTVEAERERKLRGKAAELARANHELERFTYAASHDLKAPLRALSVLPEWIEEDLADAGEPLPSSVAGHISDMKRQSQRLDRLLSDLLDYCRIGWNASDAAPVETANVVADAIEIVPWPQGFRVETEGDWPVVPVVEVELSLVLRNLLTNAAKHHDRLDGRVEVIGKATDESFQIDVIDDGPGIAQAYQDRVFEMFRTLKPRDDIEGSGVGLAMVRRIAERWHAKVELLSPWSNMRGACFRITIPLPAKTQSSTATVAEGPAKCR